MSTVLPPKLSAQFDGLWLLDGQREEFDDELAKTRIALGAQHAPPLHGNYTKFCYHRVVMRSGNPLAIKDDERIPPQRIPPQFPDPPTPNCVLDIFDESGECGHFVWDPSIHWGKGDEEWGAWRFVNEPIVVEVSADPEHPYLPKGDRCVLQPTLTLTNSSDNNYPRNGALTGAPYPLAVDCPSPEVRPQQHIYYDPQPNQLVWVRPDLNLHARFSQPKADEPPKSDTWNNLFVNSIPQWYFALVGWNPSKLSNPVYEAIADSGTQPVVAQGAQDTHNTPIFAVPDPDSQDYVVETIGQHEKVYLPRGTRLDYRPTEVSEAHTQLVSSQSELINSWTLTLGLSAGIEKVLSIGAKGSYGEKTKQQFEQERRRTVSRRVKTDYAYFTDVMDLNLTPGFRHDVFDRLHKLNVGDDPDWNDFVDNYGTHYVHAITYGSTDFAETLYSMDAETFAWEKSYSLEYEAKAALEGVDFGEKAGIKQDWGQKLGTKVSSEDVTHVIIGAPGQPAAIFLDLRPSWELFSPVFFPPDFTKDASPDRAVAPFIWRKLRDSFEEYVRGNTIQVGQPLDPSCDVSYEPRFLKVTLPEFKIWAPNQSPCIYGEIDLWGVNTGQANTQLIDGIPPVSQLDQLRRNWNVSSDDSQRISNGSDLPGIGDVSLTCACSPANFQAGSSYGIAFRLVNWDPFSSPQIANQLRFRFCDGDQVFEWHGDDGWGHKIRIKVEQVEEERGD